MTGDDLKTAASSHMIQQQLGSTPASSQAIFSKQRREKAMMMLLHTLYNGREVKL